MPHGLMPLGSIIVAPRVWVLTGNKAGDNSQVLALAEALGWPFEIKRFVHTRFEIVPNMLLRSTIAGIDREESSPTRCAMAGPGDLRRPSQRADRPLDQEAGARSRPPRPCRPAVESRCTTSI